MGQELASAESDLGFQRSPGVELPAGPQNLPILRGWAGRG
jgi:hypothetical protein